MELVNQGRTENSYPARCKSKRWQKRNHWFLAPPRKPARRPLKCMRQS